MGFFDISFGGFFIRLAELLGGPFKEPSMLWFALPLLASLIIIELNTGSVKKSFWKDSHELKQAFPHSIVLFFVAMDLTRRTFELKSGFGGTIFSGMFLAALAVLLLAIFVFLFDYYLEFPRKTYLGLTLHLPINAIAYMCIIASYLETGFDLNSILATVAFTALIGLLIFLVKRVDTSEKNERSSVGRTDYTPRSNAKKKQIFDDDFTDYTPKKQSKPANQTKQVKSSEGNSEEVDLSKSNLTWFKK